MNCLGCGKSEEESDDDDKYPKILRINVTSAPNAIFPYPIILKLAIRRSEWRRGPVPTVYRAAVIEGRICGFLSHRHPSLCSHIAGRYR